MPDLKRYRAFGVEFVGKTDKRAPRITIYDLRLNRRITIPFLHNYANAEDVARKYIEDRGIKITAIALLHTSGLLLTEDFTTEIK